MATSGTVTWRLNVEQILVEAYERCGRDAQILTNYQTTTAMRSLNLLFVEWANEGVNYWATSQVTLDMVSGTQSYTLPAGTVDIVAPVYRRSGADTELTRLSLDEWQFNPSKTTAGLSTSYYLDRQYTPVLYLWPVPDKSTDDVVYWKLSQLEDIDTLTDDADVPYRWNEAMCAGLAKKLCEKDPQINIPRLQHLALEATRAFENASVEERDKANLQVTLVGRR